MESKLEKGLRDVPKLTRKNSEDVCDKNTNYNFLLKALAALGTMMLVAGAITLAILLSATTAGLVVTAAPVIPIIIAVAVLVAAAIFILPFTFFRTNTISLIPINTTSYGGNCHRYGTGFFGSGTTHTHSGGIFGGRSGTTHTHGGGIFGGSSGTTHTHGGVFGGSSGTTHTHGGGAPTSFHHR